ncbi:MAG: hypothetical protein MI751_14840 [Pseudomonadales bacterium]|nr:hypothetical protein [Pseudomonadales bacterium]
MRKMIRCGHVAMAAAFTLAWPGYAQAGNNQNIYHVSGSLEDGYYGYSSHSPERYRFLLVQNGVPVIYLPRSQNTQCEYPKTVKDYFFSSSADKATITLLVGSQLSATPSTLRRNTIRGSAGIAPISKVRTDKHFPCTGRIERRNH